MENFNVVEEKTKEILKEASLIYGFEKSQSVLYHYANYIEMRRNKEIDFGNYNILIRNGSAYDSAEKLVDVLAKLLKEKNVISTEYKYLERNDFRFNEKSESIKEELLVFDTKKSDSSIRNMKKDLKELIEKFPNKIFILIDEDIIQGSINADFGDLISWTMEIERISSDNKIDYINKSFKSNKIELEPNNTFVKTLAKEPYWKVKNEMINIIMECKINNITKLTDKIVENELNSEFINKKSIRRKKDTNKNPLMELNKMIGIDEVKKQVYQVINYIELAKKRDNMPMLHMCFEGNPGTGKTTVARIIGEIFREKNILSNNGKFVEAQRADLVGEFVGQTAPKTKRVIDKADGGVLFIDEAYSIASYIRDEGGRDYGAECIATLLKEMEDKRDTLCVIMAGYTNEMNHMLKVNPGFESRIQFKIKFLDYTENELYEIFKQNCRKENYNIARNIKKILLDYFREEKKKENFSNARFVRNLFEKVKFEQADRIFREKVSNINMITKQDIQNVLNKCEDEEEKSRVKLGFAC